MLDAARESGLVEDLKKKAVEVARFAALVDRLTALATGPVEEILGHVLAETGYREQLQNSENEEDQERVANIDELLTAARQFDERHAGDAHLSEFLEEASLVSDTDAWDAETDRVTLMTLHASKGLEFPVVHIVALEDGLIPHERSRDQPDDLEEERRLLFVGMTRAREELHLSMAIHRDFRGQRRMTVPSSFLYELPLAEIESSEEAWLDPLADAAAKHIADNQFGSDDDAFVHDEPGAAEIGEDESLAAPRPAPSRPSLAWQKTTGPSKPLAHVGRGQGEGGQRGSRWIAENGRRNASRSVGGE